jgi:hypothetical protein
MWGCCLLCSLLQLKKLPQHTNTPQASSCKCAEQAAIQAADGQVLGHSAGSKRRALWHCQHPGKRSAGSDEAEGQPCAAFASLLRLPSLAKSCQVLPSLAKLRLGRPSAKADSAQLFVPCPYIGSHPCSILAMHMLHACLHIHPKIGVWRTTYREDYCGTLPFPTKAWTGTSKKTIYVQYTLSYVIRMCPHLASQAGCGMGSGRSRCC